jgi:putative phosphoribosyl transferase
VNSYQDREQAGDALAEQLTGYTDRPEVIVLGLVRGGVPVAARVARSLHAPLDVLVVRKLGVPWSPEVGFGALGPGGARVLNPDVADGISAEEVDRVTGAEGAELARREAAYRSGRPPLDLTGRTAILVDDGLATGATAAVAVEVARRLGAARTVLAAPVGSAEAAAWLRKVADEVVCPLVPADFGAVSRFYQSFPQTTDDEVTALLAGRPPSG